MATTKQSSRVKCLNKSPGHKRFVFKTFRERVDDIDIDVFRSLQPVKLEPSEGSTFLRDALLHWRELNTAEDFISFYEETLPIAQTLPQILLHKERIFSGLIGRLRMESRLSLEPILALIAALSRDLLKEFMSLLPRLVASLVYLLGSGGEQDSEVLEQVFTSWSYVTMHLQKYLMKNMVQILKITTDLRYYSKDHIQEFMAESTSFLMRTAPTDQLQKGINRIVDEVAKKSSVSRKNGAIVLLWHVIRGTSSRLHSKAEEALSSLVNSSILSSPDNPGSDSVMMVISGVLQKLCKEQTELSMVWSILLGTIYHLFSIWETNCSGDCLLHISRLLFILNSSLQQKGGELSDYEPVINLATFLVEKHIVLYKDITTVISSIDLLDRTLEFLLCLLDLPCIHDNLSVLNNISLQWAPIFKLGCSSLLSFIKQLLSKEINVISALRVLIFSALNDLIDSCSEDVLYLILTFYERENITQISDRTGDSLAVMFPRLKYFFLDKIHYVSSLAATAVKEGEGSLKKIYHSELALIWGVLRCYWHFCDKNECFAAVRDLIYALNDVLDPETEMIAGISKSLWQGLLAAALSLYHKLIMDSESMLPEIIMFLQIAKRNKSSGPILVSVAEFLDSALGLQNETAERMKLAVFGSEELAGDISVFSGNLAMSDKVIRLATLRILSHLSSLNCNQTPSDWSPRKNESYDSLSNGTQDCNVAKLLLSIESTAISVSTSRRIIIVISRIEAELNAGKIPDAYIPLLSQGLIGIFHNRFTQLWEPTMMVFKILIMKYKDVVWDLFVRHLGNYQSQFLCGRDGGLLDIKDHNQSDLGKCFSSFLTSDSDTTPGASMLSLLLQLLQKVPSIAESHSQQLVPLFLKFLGYCEDNSLSVEVFATYQCSKKEWKLVLLEWLNLLFLMCNSRSIYNHIFIKNVLVNRFLDDTDSEIQLKVLECLFNWRDEFLLPYRDHLRNLIDQKSLREELTTWSISKDSHCIEEVHREYLVPFIIRILVPKVRSVKTLASRKHAGLNQRKAILSFLAQLSVDELELFFSLLLEPLVSNHYNLASPDTCSVQGGTWFLVSGSLLMNIDNLSLKKCTAFLNVLDDLLRTFDELRLRPFLNRFTFIVVRILEKCSLNRSFAHEEACHNKTNLDSNMKIREAEAFVKDSLITSKKQLKDIRLLCLKIISFVLGKYPDHDVDMDFWDTFFRSVQPLMSNLKQEAASCGKPSALLSCFVAMSHIPKLASLLDRDADLLPIVFSILTVARISDTIVSSVLVLIENLLSLDSEINDEKTNSGKSVVRPHIELIITSLRELFQNRKKLKQKTLVAPGKMEVGVLRLLVRYVDKPLTAQYFLEIISPLFRKKLLTSHECNEGLHVLRGIIPFMDKATIMDVLSLIQSLLVSSELNVRLIICDILDLLSAKDSSMLFLAKVIRHLNAMSSSGLDEPDYDTRINAYDNLKPESFRELQKDYALTILSHCVYDMSSEDLIFRQCAHSSLLSFIHFAACVLNPESITSLVPLSNGSKALELNNVTGVDSFGFWTKSSIVKVIKKFFLPNIGNATRKDVHIQRGWMLILREMVLQLPEISALNSLRPLCNEDLEADFFNNIFHLQIHKRAKALSLYKKVASAGRFSEDLSVKIFVPFFFSMILDIKEGKAEHIRNAYMESLACLCGQMQWHAYYRVLMRCWREISLKADKQKLLLRLICLVLDQFHFSNIQSVCTQEQDESAIQNSKCGEEQLSISNISGHHGGILIEIHETLQKTVLPQVLKLLNVDSEKINVNVNLVALKLLKLLSSELMELHLPGIIHHIANFLKNKLESVRDEARSALVVCLKELGLEYLQFIVKAMSSVLRRGYELHVLGYTLNYILSKSLAHPTTGILDYCLEDLLLIVENDILGDVAEEKEVGKIASKMKETRNHMSYDTLKLISQNVSFKAHSMELLSLVSAHLQKHLTAKTKDKIVKMLHHIAIGIKSNPSAEQKDVLVFVYGLIEDGGVIENTNRKDLATISTNKNKRSKMSNKVGSFEIASISSQWSHLIVVFGLEVLNNCLKNMKLNKEDKYLVSILDPFVKLLASCLASKFEDVLSATFNCLIPLSRLHLPSLETHAEDIKVLLIDILQTSTNPNGPLMQSCIKLFTTLLTTTSLSNDQLRMLIQFPLFIDLETNPSSMSLSLLKQMVGQKLEVPEFYEIILRIAKLMVTGQSESVRRKCSHILLKFLLDYPLSNKCRQEHVNFLLTNLSYEHASGREAVLEMLNVIMAKFPKRVVETHSQAFFIRLVLALANEKDDRIHSMILAVVKHLMKRSKPDTLRQFIDYSISWYICENRHLWKASAQVISLLLEVFKDGFQGRTHHILQVVQHILGSSMVLASKEVKTSDNIDVFWDEGFYSLELFGKMLLQFPELYKDQRVEALWDTTCTFLQHPYLKLRNISSHLLAMYFSAATVDGAKTGIQGSIKQRWFLLDPARLFNMAVSFCIQLTFQSIDDACGNLITQNIAYAICNLHSYAKMHKNISQHEFWSGLDLHEKNSYLEALDLLGLKKVKNSFLFSQEANEIPGCQDQLPGIQSLLVGSLFKKLGKIAFLTEESQLKAVFNSFRMIASQIGAEDSREYALYIVEPIYKVCEGFTGTPISDKAKQSVEEIRRSMEQQLGADFFLQAYNTVRKKLKEKREKRRQEEKLMVLTDPARSAKRKLLKSAKNRAHKRRKILGLKMERWRR